MTSYPDNKYEQITPSYLLSVNEGLINVNIERAKKPTTPNENIMEMEQDTLSFITTYCPSLSFDEHHIRKRLEGVQTDRLKRTFKDTKLVFGKRQPMNLKRLLTSSAFSSLPAEHHTEGITHCKDKRCQLCRQGFLKVTDQVISPVGRLLFKIEHEFSCKSTNILYYMTCTICGKDYVGQTKDFRKRMNNHKSDIRGTPNEETLSIDKHIHYCQLEKYQTFVDPFFHVIPFLYIKEQRRRETLEKYYIKKFDTALNEKGTL